MNKRRLRNLHLCVDVACLCLFGALLVAITAGLSGSQAADWVAVGLLSAGGLAAAAMARLLR